MRQAATLEELLEFAEQESADEREGHTFINQADWVEEETVLTDEDTGGALPLQLIRLIVQSAKHAIYYEYPFSEPAELEDMNYQLDPVFTRFPRVVLNREEMDRKKEECQE
ncbi:hypothetical protein OXB_2279 [Bacillus sp. OxB-1]|uniref:hypothetical protein n=1 Tax=Bacillus sp. (strain OxB-1) TaxID=98228 RepID=UPI0005820572|nr:hypothetical protein [Bacillus sp. OxB-1]BAQ10750.1 hypothetical protein OXB_2279 [Bacillus sp. OxB-1]